MAKIILYWSNLPKRCGYKSIEEWKNAELKFSPLHDLVFRSHERLGNKVELWTHQKITDFSYEGIEIKDASEIISHEIVYKTLEWGHSIAFVADAIRIKRASQVLGIVLDMDCVCLRSFPKHDSWFSTMPAKRTGSMAPKWGPKKPPMKVHDGSWNGKELTIFPIKIGKTTQKIMSEFADKIILKLQMKPRGGTDEWNSILWTVKAIANTDVTAKIYQPIYMSPLPAWLGSGKCYSLEDPTRLDGETELFGYPLPSINEILEKSYCVAHFFESAFQEADHIGIDQWNNIPENSLLAAEMDFIGYK